MRQLNSVKRKQIYINIVNLLLPIVISVLLYVYKPEGALIFACGMWGINAVYLAVSITLLYDRVAENLDELQQRQEDAQRGLSSVFEGPLS